MKTPQINQLKSLPPPEDGNQYFMCQFSDHTFMAKRCLVGAQCCGHVGSRGVGPHQPHRLLQAGRPPRAWSSFPSSTGHLGGETVLYVETNASGGHVVLSYS